MCCLCYCKYIFTNIFCSGLRDSSVKDLGLDPIEFFSVNLRYAGFYKHSNLV